MEFNAVQQQYRASANGAYAGTRPLTRHTGQMSYPYGDMRMQQQQPSQQAAQQMTQQLRPPATYASWPVVQPNPSYADYQRPPVAGSREYEHAGARNDVSVSNSPAISTATFRNGIGGAEPLSSTDFFPGVIDTSPWAPKVYEELESFPSMDPDMTEFNQGLLSHDENTPIIHLGQYHGGMEQPEADNMATFNPTSTRRMSESSFSMSSTGGVLQDVSTYEDMGPSEAISYPNEYDGWNGLEAAPSLLSPLASPRRPQHESVVRSGSRSRASPVPHNNVRSSPYTLESSRLKRWSTGHAPTSTPSSSRPLSQVHDRFAPYPPRMNPHHSMPAYPPSAMPNFGSNVLYSQPHPLQSSNPTMFASQDQPFQLEVPRPLPSQGLFRLLQSNADRHGGCASHFADLSDPPDLYSSLHEEPSTPPESDMNPSDPDLVPHEQDLRFNGDLYTPRWVRGHGNKREGWCGLCKPGRWLVLKNSAFWYDKSFTHGVSAATGAAFQGPQETRRTEGNPDVWEGLCGSCGGWIALVSSKKKGTTWFRHAYKCHSHPKVKDGPKRRRETASVRARAASSASSTSSSYPVKKESSGSQNTTGVAAPPSIHSYSSQARPLSQPQMQPQQSTPTGARPASSQQYVGMPASQPTTAFPIASEASTQSLAGASQTRTSSTLSMPSLSLSMPSSSLSSTSHSEAPTTQPQQPPVVGMFSSPLQPLSTFSSASLTANAGVLHVSEPELVGIKPSSAFSSLASMI